MQDLDRVDEIMGYLISYVTKNVIPFVRSNGGWVSSSVVMTLKFSIRSWLALTGQLCF